MILEVTLLNILLVLGRGEQVKKEVFLSVSYLKTKSQSRSVIMQKKVAVGCYHCSLFYFISFIHNSLK